MNFYNILSKYYDEVFPVREEMLNFVKNNITGKHILDVGCGNGKLDLLLSGAGIKVTGIDLDETMIERGMEAANKSENSNNVEFKVMNMLEVGKNYKYTFHNAICLGNTLVHLKDAEEIKKAIKEVKVTLKENGKIIIQIINYDRILKENIKELPIIETENVLFKREYEVSHSQVNFKTSILDKNINEEYKNETRLYPLFKEDLKNILKKCGFKTLEFYGDYKGAPYKESSYHTIVVAR